MYFKNQFFTHDVASLLLRNMSPCFALSDNKAITFVRTRGLYLFFLKKNF